MASQAKISGMQVLTKTVSHVVRSFRFGADVAKNAMAFLLLLTAGYALAKAFPLDISLNPLKTLQWRPETKLASWPYWVFCLAALIAFANIGKRRRLQVILFMVIMIVVHYWVEKIGFARIVLSSSIALVVTAVHEVIRQNIPLALKLIKNPLALARALLRSIAVWSFMVVIIIVGFFAHKELADWANSFIYSATAINEYCDIKGLSNLPPVPCEEVNRTLRRGDFMMPDEEEAVALYVSENISDSFRKWMSALESAEYLDLTNEEAFGKLIASLPKAPHEISGLAGIGEVDTELVGLEKARDDLARTIERRKALVNSLEKRRTETLLPISWGNMAGVLGARFPSREEQLANAEVKHLSVRLAQARRRVDARRVELAATEQGSLRGIVSDLPSALAAWSPVSVAAMFQKMAVATDLEQKREIAIEQAALAHADGDAYVLAILGKLGTMKAEGADVPPQQSAAVARLFDGIRYRYCSLTRESKEIFTKDDGTGPVLINVGTFPCPFGIDSEEQYVLVPDDVVSSINISIAAAREREDRSTDARFIRGVAEIGSSADKSAAAAKAAAEIVPREVHLGRKNCHGYFRTPFRCGENKIKEKTENVYRNERAEAGKEYEKGVDTTVASAHAQAISQIIVARTNAHEALKQSQLWAHRMVGSIVDGQKLLSLLGILALAFACIKSFLVATSIVLFDVKGIADSSLRGPAVRGGRITIHKELRLPTSMKGRMIGKYVLQNQEKHWRLLPWPFLSVIPRLVNGCYLMLNKAVAFEVKTPMTAEMGSDVYLVHWRLRPGEEVVFHYKNFFAISENVELLSEVSLRIDTLPLGRLVFSVARCKPGSGTGRLILAVHGKPTDRGVVTTELSRLIAWNRNAAFRLSSDRNGRAMWWNGTMVKLPAANGTGVAGRVLVGPVSQSSGAFGRLWENLRTALSPI